MKTIVRAAIHPGIGIARLGSSKTDYLLAPETPNPPPRAADSSHDGSGELKREAVRFRIYGYDAEGEVVAELTAANAELVWTAHVANAKSAWFKFRHAMDIPSLSNAVVERRNPLITDPEAREAMIIDPGPRSISGVSQGGAAEHRFDTGTYKSQAVYLGELATDKAGRLLFLPGRGASSSPSGAPSYVATEVDPFGNATDWHDDIADGPIDAIVRIDGREIPVEGAWVVSAPPNYAPDLKAWRTLCDLVHDIYVEAGWCPKAQKASFTKDIYPVLSRLSAMQWVNKAFAAVFGHGAPFDFNDPRLIDKLSRIHGGATDLFRPLRTAVLNAFRTPDDSSLDNADWPFLYGDAFDDGAKQDPARALSLGGARLKALTDWVAGDFIADWGTIPPLPSRLEEYGLSEQPAALDRAALDFCAADAFHPGIELTWPMRHVSVYSAPFRITRAKSPEPDYGDSLDVTLALGPNGPLHGQFAGSLSRWMLVPWQVDTGGCLSGYYDPPYDAPSFWPTRVPNNVLARADYDRAVDTSASSDSRREALASRRSWFYHLGQPGSQWGHKLINLFGRQGVIEARPGPTGDPEIPSTIYVETHPDTVAAPQSASFGAALAQVQASDPDDRRAQAAGFADAADLEAVRRMRFGP